MKNHISIYKLGSALFVDIVLLIQAITFIMSFIIPETGVVFKAWEIGKEIIVVLCLVCVVIKRDGFPSTERMSAKEITIWTFILYGFISFYALWAFRYYVFDPESTDIMIVVLCRMISIFATIFGVLFVGAQVYFLRKKIW